MALADGFGVRVLIGDLDIEHARREVWAGLADELGLPEEPPPPLGGQRARAECRNAPLTAPAGAARFPESPFKLLGGG